MKKMDALLADAKERFNIRASRWSDGGLCVKMHWGFWSLIYRTHGLDGTTYTIIERITEEEARYLVKKRDVHDLLGEFDGKGET